MATLIMANNYLISISVSASAPAQWYHLCLCLSLYFVYLFTHNIEDVMESELHDIQLMNDDPGEWYIQAVLYGKWF